MFHTLKLATIALALVVAGCSNPVGLEQSTATQYKEGASCTVVEVVRPRRGEPTTRRATCRPHQSVPMS